ncbi:phytoene desaturase family protein [Chloroflexota bacterium]
MPQGKYDVVIIGSGVGGICAAALLAHAGYQILLVERTPLLGGRCSTMEYQDFKLTTGVISMSPGATVNQVFNEVGAPFDVIHVTRLAYRVAGKDYEMPLKGGLGWLLSQVSGSDEETEKVMGALSRAFSWQEPSTVISFREWLLQYTDNQYILDVFQSMIPAMMVINSWEVSAQTVIRFLNFARYFRVSGFAPDGNQKLMAVLADVIRRHGGNVWTRCPARQILVSNGVASGVIVEKEGKQLEIVAQAVVSDTGPRKTVELAGGSHPVL